jgi:putative membrane protein
MNRLSPAKTMLPDGRSVAMVLGFGFVAAIAGTWWLRTQDTATSLGFVYICGPNTVPAPEFPQALTTFAIEPIPLYLLAGATLAYLAMFRRARERGQARLFPVRRAVCFVSGAVLVGMTVFGPLAAYDHTFLSVHMIQHFLLITIAPPLLLAGAPLTLVLVSLTRSERHRLVYPVLHSRAFHAFTHPGVGLALFALIPTTWYITPMFELSLESDILHYVGYGVFLFAGIHYWWPIMPFNPTRWHMPFPVQLLYLFALLPIHAFLGLLFYEPSQVLYPALEQAPRAWGPGPLMDQQFAGAFMFVMGEAIGLLALLLVAYRWSKHDERQARRMDEQRARQRAMKVVSEAHD